MAMKRLWALLLSIAVLVAAPVLCGAAPPDEGTGHLVSVQLRDAPLADALNLLFQGTGYSFRLEPGASGKVTATLNGLPFDRALKAVLDVNGLTYRIEPRDLYVIGPRKEPATPSGQSRESQPRPEAKVYFIGPGGRYELQALDARQVAVWFGGRVAAGSPVPVPLTGGQGYGFGAIGGVGIGGFGAALGRGGTTGGVSALSAGGATGGRG